jgi:hypothetical protein
LGKSVLASLGGDEAYCSTLSTASDVSSNVILAALPITELVEVIVEAILSDCSGFLFDMCLRRTESVCVGSTMLVDILLSYRN